MFKPPFILMILLVNLQAYKPSWCFSNRLTQTEWTICSNKFLYELDNKMTDLYKDSDSNNKVNTQKRWLKYRRNRCGTDLECLKVAYEDRIKELQSNKPLWCNNRLNQTEWTICSHRFLYELDNKMVKAYKYSNMPNKSFSQKYWLENIRDACGSDTDCIENAYDKRLAELQRDYHYHISQSISSGYNTHNSSESHKSIDIRNCQHNMGAIACNIFINGNYSGRIYYKNDSKNSYMINTVGSIPESPATYSDSLHALYTVKCGNTGLGRVQSLAQALYMDVKCALNGSLR